MADVFISYKREERARAQAIARGLQELGLSVWFDASLQGGGSFSAQINREVRGAKAVLVLWTPAAAHSEWVIGEAEIGRGRGVLAPVFLAPTDLPPPFNTLHAQDLAGWSGGHADDEWLALLDRIDALTGGVGLRRVASALSAGESVPSFGANEAQDFVAHAETRPPERHEKRSLAKPKLGLSLLSLAPALVAGLFGFGGIASAAAGIAQILFFGFFALFVGGMILAMMRRS